MTRGETLKILIDYDLFGINVKDHFAVYLKTDESTGKHLVYFFGVGEFAEFEDSSVERTNPDVVTEDNKNFISRVRTLIITCPL